MNDRTTPPRLPPTPIQALFSDLKTAQTAIEAMLQGGFTGEQLALLRADDSLFSPANDLGTYRATGMQGSHSTTGMDTPAIADDPTALSQRERELAWLREHAVVVTVAPFAHQEANAREMLTSLGGRLLRADGSLETEAA